MIRGIDISNWQGKISTLGSDVKFVIIKATEGTGYTSPTFKQQRDVARASGKVVGYYHFASLTDAVAEANHFADAIGKLKIGEFLALDWETGSYNEDIDQWCSEFLTEVATRTGVMPLLYSNASRINAGSWAETRALGAGLWIAAYGKKQPSPKPWDFAAIWQNSDNGKVQGINGRVDTDIFFGDIDALKKYGLKEIQPQPAPVVEVQAPTADVASWATGARQKLIALGITDGTRPKDPLTREEGWVMLSRLYQKLKK